MTDACFLARGSRPLIKPTTCEDCLCTGTCKMYANYQKAMKEIDQLHEVIMGRKQ